MIEPLNKNVVLKKEASENKTSSGIILSTESKEVPGIGVVVAVSKKCEAALKPEDKVVYKKYSGTDVKVNEEDFIVIDEEDILAIVK